MEVGHCVSGIRRGAVNNIVSYRNLVGQSPSELSIDQAMARRSTRVGDMFSRWIDRKITIYSLITKVVLQN